jgi:hypothetical protein
MTPTAVGFNRFFGSKHPPIPATRTRSNYMTTLGDGSGFILDRTVDAAIDDNRPLLAPAMKALQSFKPRFIGVAFRGRKHRTKKFTRTENCA